ncbi:hypothetical protein C7H79_14180 [Nitrosomonas supralitoralis]|uniref:Uncharacterized protein n=2 Tax=Nitrosomonas supralitoralis TaxID=2116706 RepID=A0A2P7NS80_9PROT|nr:hypothetical protein C7H79_14180 [Nitrosomonas supralitoralis]
MQVEGGTMDYQSLGEYHAFLKQAKNAADKRYDVLHNLAIQIRNLAENPGKAIDMETEAIKTAIVEAKKAEFEMTAAIGCVNEAAKLCGEKEITTDDFKR